MKIFPLSKENRTKAFWLVIFVLVVILIGVSYKSIFKARVASTPSPTPSVPGNLYMRTKPGELVPAFPAGLIPSSAEVVASTVNYSPDPNKVILSATYKVDTTLTRIANFYKDYFLKNGWTLKINKTENYILLNMFAVSRDGSQDVNLNATLINPKTGEKEVILILNAPKSILQSNSK